ncbi:MAG TPA: ArsR family transcriptional regulator [Dehalococcoidia bacterium]|nr:ArsR family transcriptional regulator [Dehalococcoidia bacterium]
MDNTRTKILDILRRRREATVEELTKALELAPATVRRHLDILQRDGYVKVRAVRRETGRPHYAFSITEAGEELFPQHYVRITNRLVDEIMDLAPADTSGRSGRELAAVIFERMAQRMARAYAPRVNGATVAERARQAAQLLADEGLTLEVEERPGGEVLLLGRGCPCQRLAARDIDVCSHDRKLLSELLKADVEPWPDTGGAYCAYVVRERARAGG